VVFATDTDKNEPKEPESTFILNAFTSLELLAVVAAIHHKGTTTSTRHVSRKSPNARRRKGTVEDPGGIQARDRREIRSEILHHKSGRKYCSNISLRGMERIEQKLAALSTYNPTKKKFLTFTNYYGQVVEMDGQGRLLVPQILRESAQIRGEVAVLGQLTYLEVRNMEALQKEIDGQAFTDDDTSTLDKLGI